MELGAKRFLLAASLIAVVAGLGWDWLSSPRGALRVFMCEAHAGTYDALTHPRPGIPYVPKGMSLQPGWCAPGDVGLDLVGGPAKFRNWYRVSCSGKPQFVASYTGSKPAPLISIEPLAGYETIESRANLDCVPNGG